jgi:acyl-CoA synthetase (NDP forming)
MLALRHAREHRGFLDRRGDGGPIGDVPTPRRDLSSLPRGVLPNVDAIRLLMEFGIQVAAALPAIDAEEAVRAAERLGYPVALKVDSKDNAHKTDAEVFASAATTPGRCERARASSPRCAPGSHATVSRSSSA